MGLLSIFQRNKQTAAKSATPGRGGKSAARQAPLANAQNPADTAEAVREARARARRRLMGATVLLLIGVIGFPLLFETQPRPIPVDLPIEIPARNAPGIVDASSGAPAHGKGNGSAATSLSGAGSTSVPAASGPQPEHVSYDARPAASAPDAASAPPVRRSAFASLAAALTSSSARASDADASASPGGTTPGSAVAQAKPSARPVKAAASTAAAAAAVASKPPAHVAAAPSPASTPSPAALLAGAVPAKPSDAVANGGRFVVQVGAFTDDAKIHEVRAKVEKIGLKTYTQQVETPGGKRVRVRVGPFATKAEADRIASKIKADGLPAAVLAL
jgi:DedD protein